MSLTPALRAHFGAPSDRGVLVAAVEPATAAAKAGIAVGDVITSVHGRPVATADDLRAALAKRDAGERAQIQLVRDGLGLSIEAALPTDASAWAAIGVEAAMKWLLTRQPWVGPPAPAVRSGPPSWMRELRERFAPTGGPRRE